MAREAREMARGSTAIAASATRHGQSVVMLVRPLDAPNALAEYETEMESVARVLCELKKASAAHLLPELFETGVLTGSTEHAPRISRFGVQVWERVKMTVEEFVTHTKMTRAQFASQLIPLIQGKCAELHLAGLQHTDLHLQNVAVDTDKACITRLVFLDPASIRPCSEPYRQCDGQSLINDFDELVGTPF